MKKFIVNTLISKDIEVEADSHADAWRKVVDRGVATDGVDVVVRSVEEIKEE